jgi:hypothetical protein
MSEGQNGLNGVDAWVVPVLRDGMSREPVGRLRSIAHVQGASRSCI